MSTALAVRAYGAIISARFRMLLQYRAAAIAGFATQLFWGLIRVMIFEAFYRSTTAPQPMTIQQVVNYVWLGQALLLLIPMSIDREILAMVRSGSVAYELLRPIDLYGLWFCRAIAGRTAPTLLRSVPLFLLAWVFFGLQLPPSVSSALAWLVAMAGALLVSCALSTALSISLLFTISGEGIARLMPTVVYFLCGMAIPLPLFPSWAQPILDFLPFRGIVDVPFRVYSGNIPPQQLPALFAQQLLWTSALVLLGRWLIRRATRRLVVQGG